MNVLSFLSPASDAALRNKRRVEDHDGVWRLDRSAGANRPIRGPQAHERAHERALLLRAVGGEVGAVQAHSQYRRRRQHLTCRMGAQAADRFEPDLEKPIGIWQAYVLFHGFAFILIDFFTMSLVAASGGRQVAARAPFRPGAVVESRSPFAEYCECEHENGGGHARSATGDDRLRPVHASFFEGRGERVGLFQTTVGDEVGGWNIEAARHVAAAHPRARFRRGAGEAVGRARIEHLRRAVFERSTDLVDLGDETVIEPRGEMPRLAGDRTVFERTSLGPPLRQAAVEDRHFAGAEGA